MFAMMSKLEKNLLRIQQSPEASYELENATVAWEENTGRPPDHDEMEEITNIILRERSWLYRTVRGILALVILYMVGHIFVRGLLEFVCNVSNAKSFW